MEKKYELINYNPKTKLYQIRALRDFADVKAGDIGGFVSGEHNLSHDGDCWIYDNGHVFGDGRVSGNGRVSNNGRVYDNGHVFGDGRVSGNGSVYDNGHVFGDGHVYGNGRVSGNGSVYDNGHVFGDGRVFGNGHVYDNGRVAEKQHVRFGELTVDITDNQNKAISVFVQTNCGVNNAGYIYCYKSVNPDLTSRNDFQYKVGEWVEEPNTDPDPLVSCGSGLHFSHLTYWAASGTFLLCKVHIDDVVAVQEGKIRAKKAFVFDKIVV